MRRTKQWWNKLIADERSELCWLERCNLKWATRGSAGLPDDCLECENCSTPHSGMSLCPACNQRLDEIINKADSMTKQNLEPPNPPINGIWWI
jgi:hypothetical protein